MQADAPDSHNRTRRMNPVFDLAIVGGGPTALACRLAIRRMRPQWRVFWLGGLRPGFAPAYAGGSPEHRLNVPVERMGLDPDAPGEFLDWLRREHPQRAVEPGQFVARHWYGEYLASLVATLGGAGPLAAEARVLCKDETRWCIEDSGGGRNHALRVVLALGQPPPVPMPEAPPVWIHDPWSWWHGLGNASPGLAAGDVVLLVGSGLTAVDFALGLRARGFEGMIRVVSTSGRWSTAHAPAPPVPAEQQSLLLDLLAAQKTARGLLWALRRAASIHPWQSVFDVLRPATNRLWQALPMVEQARVLRHLMGPWNRHRHRMPADVEAALAADRALTIERGRVRCRQERIEIWRGTHCEVLRPALALDCRGPGFSRAVEGQALLARLVRSGVLQAHPLGIGVCQPPDASLALLGAARMGESFETLAIPELREQAYQAVERWAGADPS